MCEVLRAIILRKPQDGLLLEVLFSVIEVLLLKLLVVDSEVLVSLPDELVTALHWSWLDQAHVDVALECLLDSLPVDELSLAVFGYLKKDRSSKLVLLPVIVDILVV